MNSNTRLAISDVERILDGPAGKTIGAIIVEPIQGRGGHVIPPDDFLPALRRIADARDLLLIFDEIYTGLGRTGKLWACEHTGVVPDLLLTGKALASGFPISACIGNERAMAGWPASTGEAIHTYTFLGHPAGCAMACASLDEIIGRKLSDRAAELGEWFLSELRGRLSGCPAVVEVRGRGLLIGIELTASRPVPGPGLGVAVMKECLRRGLLVLTGGQGGNVICLTPPLTVTRGQLAVAAEIIADAVNAATAPKSKAEAR